MRFLKAAAAAVIAGWVSLAHAAPDLPELKMSTQTDILTLGGDLRLRNEYFDFRDQESSTVYTTGARKNDRNRQRFRLRLKADWKLHNDFTVVAGLASGTGEAVSTNQSLTSSTGQKQIWIDQAYMKWAPTYLGADGSLSLMGGRMSNPLWKLYTSDVIWDGDFSPEGFAQSASYLVGGMVNVFANAQQAAMNEISGSPRDPWLLSEQIGIEVPLPLGLRFVGAGAKHTALNESGNAWGSSPVQMGNAPGGLGNSGNRLSTSLFTNEYDVLEFTGQISGWIPVPIVEVNLPFAILGTFVKNNAARGPDWSGTVNGGLIKADGKHFFGKSDQGGQIGVILGKASAAGSFEIAYFYKRVANDATLADIADSDFGEGGLNRKGNIGWISYCPTSYITATVKVFNVRLLDKRYAKNISGSNINRINQSDKINRVQADLSIKF